MPTSITDFKNIPMLTNEFPLSQLSARQWLVASLNTLWGIIMGLGISTFIYIILITLAYFDKQRVEVLLHPLRATNSDIQMRNEKKIYIDMKKEIYMEMKMKQDESISETDIKKSVLDQSRVAARNKALFAQNLRSTLQIKSVKFNETKIFKAISWQLSPQINIMLGRNGFGKSYLLHILVALLSYDNKRLQTLVGDSPLADLQLGLLHNGQTAKVEHKAGMAFEQSVGQVPLLAIPDARFINRESESIAADGKYADLTQFGGKHFLYNLPFESTIQTVLTEMCIEVIAKFGDAHQYPDTSVSKYPY
jgi:energy-coupling factor transporter ATP-binding protein EcfA2